MFFWRLSLACVLCVFFLSGYAAKPITVHVDPGKPFFMIALPSNPTTGYQWQVVKQDKTIRLVDSHYVAPASKLIGAGGQSCFRFQCVNKTCPASTKIGFSYARPWDKSSATSQLVSVLFNLKGK